MDLHEIIIIINSSVQNNFSVLKMIPFIYFEAYKSIQKLRSSPRQTLAETDDHNSHTKLSDIQ